MSDWKIDTGGGNVLDCLQVVEDAVMRRGDEIDAMCWQRIRARLTPDRESVARALYEHAMSNQGAVTWEGWLAKADAAIDAARGAK